MLWKKIDFPDTIALIIVLIIAFLLLFIMNLFIFDVI
jgi:hypothetical protein